MRIVIRILINHEFILVHNKEYNLDGSATQDWVSSV